MDFICKDAYLDPGALIHDLFCFSCISGKDANARKIAFIPDRAHNAQDPISAQLKVPPAMFPYNLVCARLVYLVGLSQNDGRIGLCLGYHFPHKVASDCNHLRP